MAPLPFPKLRRNDIRQVQMPVKEEFAGRLFSVVMFGICAVILLIAVLRDW
jgi:hypothetical protein